MKCRRLFHALLSSCAMVLLSTVAMAAPAGSASLPIYIEDSPAAQEMIDQAQLLRTQDRLTDAAQTLQRVVDQYPHKLIRVEDGRYEDMLLWVRGYLLEDASLLQAYRQTFDAVAARELAKVRAGRLESAALEAILARFILTDVGLEAGLDLASLYLEQADARSAVSTLDELADHPDLAAHLGRYAQLQAVAGLLSGDTERRDHYLARLHDAGHATAAAEVTQLQNRLHPPLRLTGSGSPSAQADVTLPDTLDAPLWQVPVTWSPLGEAMDPITQRLPEGAGVDGTVLPIDPVASDQRIIVNLGSEICALDRNSGWTHWRYQWQDAADADAQLPAIVRMRRATPERRGVAVTSRRVFAVMGLASAWPVRWNRDTASTALVCLDEQRGRPLWNVTPADLDPALDKAFFVGTPQIGHDRLFILIRRSQLSGFQDTFVAAVAQQTGQLLWRRHLSSAAMASRYANTPLPELVAGTDRLFVTDNLGVLASLDQRQGTVHWIRLFTDAPSLLEHAAAAVPAIANAAGSNQISGGELTLCPAGLIVPDADRSQSHLLLVDPATGQTREELAAAIWTTAAQILPLGDDLLAVGPVVTLFDSRTLKPRWSYRLNDEGDIIPLGRAAVSSVHIALASRDRLIILDRKTGKAAQTQTIEQAGNLLAIDGQLVMATARSLDSYMSWPQARDRLRQQIAEQPLNPQPGLALAHLALRLAREDTVIEGVDAALAAIYQAQLDQPDSEQIDRNRTLVFDRLMQFAASDSGADVHLRRQLFDRIAQTTASPQQEVAYHLAFAELLTQTRDIAQAVEHLQAVLADRTLATQLYQHAQVTRQAGLEARRRLTDLITAHGRGVYAAYDNLAAQQLADLRLRSRDAAALVDMADRYPFAHAAIDALMLAADRYVQQRHVNLATQQLRRAYRLASADTPQLPLLVGQLTTLYADTGKARRAIAWLEQVRQEHPTLQPVRNSQPTPVDAWLADLALTDPTDGSLPRLTLPLTTPHVLDGRLLLPQSTRWSVGPLRYFLLATDHRTLRLYNPGSDTPAWEADLPFDQPELLAADESQLLLWSPQSQQMFALARDTGQPVWSEPDLAALLEAAGDVSDRQAARTIEERRFMQMIEMAPVQVRGGRIVVDRPEAPPGSLVAIGQQVICVADHAGRIAGIDRDTGQVLWKQLGPMDQLTALVASDHTVAMTGISGAGTEAVGGLTVILDLLTGEPRLPAIEEKDVPQWLQFGGEGLLFVATSDQVTARDLITGDVAWRLQLTSAPLTGQGWADDQLLVLIDNAGMAIVIEARSGQLLDRLTLASQTQLHTLNVQPTDQGWYIVSAGGVIAMDFRGRTLWRDAITAPVSHWVGPWITRDHVTIIGRKTQSLGPEAEPAVQGPMGDVRIAEPQLPENAEADAETPAPIYTLYVLDRVTGSLLAEHPLGEFPAAIVPRRAAAVDQHLLLPLPARTVVIPGSPENRN